MHKTLHIVAFDVPYPPNYGGVIDVFYKIKALHKLGIAIYLHAFEYGKDTQTALEKYCVKTYYYPRKAFFKSFFSMHPFIVQSRSNKSLVTNLQTVKAPILFEGLHTTHALLKNALKGQKTFVRTHNIEHLYYKGLSASSVSAFKKIFYSIEAFKLKKYERILSATDGILTISPFEQQYFSTQYLTPCKYIPVFHENSTVRNANNSKKQVLYHGDLRLSDNIKAALYLIKVYRNTEIQFIIASSCKNKKVLQEINKYTNCAFANIKNAVQINELINESQVNALVTFQKTGIKLKLINALYNGSFVITNLLMVEDTGLENSCEIAKNERQFLLKTKALLETSFSLKNRELRKANLSSFHTETSAKELINFIFKL
ncbi:MAG: hypothetical protein P8K77_06380 [Polaribacter sp.]|nr:hypothetical protein [Polaribacter sp.]